MKVNNLSIVCHSLIAALELVADENYIGLEWSDLTQQQRDRVSARVEIYMQQPDMSPEQIHSQWVARMMQAGWKYGDELSDKEKTNPFMVAYGDLPMLRRVEDSVVKATVDKLKTQPDMESYLAVEGEVIKLRKENLDLRDSLVNSQPTVSNDTGKVGTTIRYVGTKLLYIDNLYDTGLTFTPKQARTLPTDIAAKFLRHPEFELYRNGDEAVHANAKDTAQQLERAKENEREARQREDVYFEEMNQISQMRKRELVEYAKTRYEQKLSEREPLEELRAKVIAFVDQFGVV